MAKTANNQAGMKSVTYVCPDCGLKQSYRQDASDFLSCEGRHCRADCSGVIEQAWRTRLASRRKVAQAEAKWADRGDSYAATKFAKFFAAWQEAARQLQIVRDCIIYECGH